VNRTDFQELAESRIAEAECLFRNELFDGAYYLAGYAVEAGLKACIARGVNQYDFPPRNAQRDCYTHDLEVLLKTAGLDRILSESRLIDLELDANWNRVKPWKEETRYDPPGSKSRALTLSFLEAITLVPHGVLPWIKLYW